MKDESVVGVLDSCLNDDDFFGCLASRVEHRIHFPKSGCVSDNVITLNGNKSSYRVKHVDGSFQTSNPFLLSSELMNYHFKISYHAIKLIHIDELIQTHKNLAEVSQRSFAALLSAR
jgi:hypothetical protein